ncbi:Ig-like domain-containing protein [Exiguobacterium alkaliphilum]|uniref:Ig-like domain-containing protein n=1 Tax=Exiguobacterium alkaliphilum TaxID=1428684 RepID=UPI00403AB652
MIEVVEATKASSPIVQKIADRSTYIEGRVTETEWVQDNIITVNDATNRKLCETHVNFDRTFSCQLKELLSAGTTVYVTQTADGYYPSDPTAVTVARTFAEPTSPIVIVPPSDVKPGTPILHPVTSDSLRLTGSGTPGLVVKAWNEFGFRLGEATVQVDGSFHIPLARKLPQDIGIRVVQLQDGKVSDGAQTYVSAGEQISLKLIDAMTDMSTRLTGHLERMSFTPVQVELRQGKTVLAKDETTFFFRLDFKPQHVPLTLALIHANGTETTQTIQPIDTTAPKLATVSTLTNRSTRVFGRAEAGSTIVVHHNKKRLTTTVSPAGVYSLNLSQLKRGDIVSVQAMDAAGNTSSPIKRTVLGVQAKLTATATPRVVSGKGESGALVRVFVGTKMIGKTVKVDSNGTYRVAIPAQAKGKSLLVTQQKTGYVKQTQIVFVQ